MSELYIKLGKLLKSERERQNKTLPDLSRDLKISEAHLTAIEAGDAAGVPSQLYFKLFAKSYAEALGLDYVKVIDSIRDDVGEDDFPGGIEPTQQPDNQSRPVIRPRTPEPRRSHVGTWILIGLGIIILGGVAWLVVSNKGKALLKHEDTDSTQAVDSGTARGDSGYTPGTAASRENSKLNLDLIARDRTWAVVIADGDTSLQTNLKPWREYYVGAQDSLVVSIGSPLSVETMINGTAANLTNPETGAISSVVITPENSTMFLQRTPFDSTGFTGDSLNTDSASTVPGTGSSPAKPKTSDSASTNRGTTDGL